MIQKLHFGLTKTGVQACKYILTNDKGAELTVSDFGAYILSIRVPDRNGEKKEVTLGYDTIEEYYDNDRGFGAYVGRNANRIADAKVILDGVEYELEVNDRECNNLHSGSNRSHYQMYDAVTGTGADGEYVEFSRLSPHLEQGFPGNLMQKIRYTLTADNGVKMQYEMLSDKTTVVNPTNHSYFNLSGDPSKDILEHVMEVDAQAFLPTDERLIPTGAYTPVEGTPMDYRKAKVIGQDIEADYMPLNIGEGIDHSFVLPEDGIFKKAAVLYSPESGINMEVYTDLCGVQIYSGQHMAGVKGRNGVFYKKYAGICFETQFHPNACKDARFKSSILDAGKEFRSCTEYRFTVK